jgi:hypothetical protein
MKRVLLVLTAIALVFAVAGCGSGGAGSGGAGGDKYTGTDGSGAAYTLVISSARAAAGDGYNLAIATGTGATLRSIGKVISATGTSITCGTEDNSFTVTVAGNRITDVVGDIPLEGNGLYIRGAGDWAKTVGTAFNKQTTWKTTGFSLGGSNHGEVDKGIILFNNSNFALLGIQTPFRTVQKNGADVQSNETNADGSGIIVVEYVVDVIAPTTQGKLTAKNGNTGAVPATLTDLNPARYIDLAINAKGSFEIEEGKYPDKSTMMWFQKNGDSIQFKLKIIDVKWKE